MSGEKEALGFKELSHFFDFLTEAMVREKMAPSELHTLLSGFEMLLAQNLSHLSLEEVKSLISGIETVEKEIASYEEGLRKEIVSEPLGAFELSRIPGVIREQKARGASKEELEYLLSQFETELNRSAERITLSQSFQLRQEIEKLKEEFAV